MVCVFISLLSPVAFSFLLLVKRRFLKKMVLQIKGSCAELIKKSDR